MKNLLKTIGWRRLAQLSAVLFVASCGTVEPYVYKAGEFNREAQGFGRPVKDISTVTVCYKSGGTNPRSIVDVAVVECARFGKRPVFSHQDRSTCPLVAPVAAHYQCVAP